MNQLYRNYTACCNGNHKTTEITPSSTNDEIRNYMFGKHNQDAEQEIHKVTPHQISDPKIQRTISPKFLKELKQVGIQLPNQLEEYVIFHAGLPVDTMSRAELSKYISQSNENPSLRQPAA